MKRILVEETGKNVTVFEDGHRFVVRFSHESFAAYASKIMTLRQKRFVTRLRVFNIIVTLAVLAIASSRLVDPFNPWVLALMGLVCGVLYVMLDYVLYLFSKLLHRRKCNFDFIFDTSDESVSFPSHPYVFYTSRYSTDVVFSIGEYPVYEGAQICKLHENSVFTIKDGKPLIELRSGLRQSKVDFLFRVLNQDATIALAAALNKVREMTVATPEKSVSPPSSSKPAPANAEKVDDVNAINPMD